MQAAKAARMPSMGKIEKQLATVLERLTQVEGALTQPPAAAPPANADV